MCHQKRKRSDSMNVQVIGFDFFGTLIDATAEVTVCLGNICTQLELHNIPISREEFAQTYRHVTRGYREERHHAYKEVNNARWLQTTLQRLGYDLEITSPPIRDAVDAYFSPWMLQVYDDVYPLLRTLASHYPLGLISNFTHAQFVHDALHRFNLHPYFKTIVISDDIGWRKPHPQIFKRFLKEMNVAADTVLFIGDDLECDVVGAHNVGMKTAWLRRTPKQSLDSDLNARPDVIINSLADLPAIIS
jgi:putative hydrolase of the HAD superfamily